MLLILVDHTVTKPETTWAFVPKKKEDCPKREKESPADDSSPASDESPGHSISPCEEKESLTDDSSPAGDESRRQPVIDGRREELVKDFAKGIMKIAKNMSRDHWRKIDDSLQRMSEIVRLLE
ncbi:hypothetical protein BHE74_00025764 [Ensete ventricosum]|nr:hypothetical protein BHE74_00025764 [Ensete ventricosum]